MQVPTVKVTITKSGVPCIIRACDFDKTIHTKARTKLSTKTDALKSAPAPKKAPAPETADEDDKPYTQAELAGMTVDAMQRLPLFSRLTKKRRASLDSKQDYITAILKLQG